MRDKQTLDYATPPAKPLPISRLAAASVLLPMAHRLVSGYFGLELVNYRFHVNSWPQFANVCLVAVMFCGPFLVFGSMAIWSLRGSGWHSRSNLYTAIAGVGINLGLFVYQAHLIYKLRFVL